MIFDIQGFSVHDGPGCRTTIFMSGCPLSCSWCANPESWAKKPSIMYSELSCRYKNGCSLCRNKCTRNALSFGRENKPILNLSTCKSCTDFKCTEACYYNALKVCSREYNLEELINLLKRDAGNWGGKGGVTFSGGEPLVQSSFLLQALKQCKENKFHTAIETSGYAEKSMFLEAMKFIDFAFIDIKHMDRERHREKTGVYNDLILSNVAALRNSSYPGRIVIRMPVIKGFNDGEENISKLIEFMNYNELIEINLLPFHRMGQSKWIQLGREYEYIEGGEVTKFELELIQDKFLENNIACYVGHDTFF